MTKESGKRSSGLFRGVSERSVAQSLDLPPVLLAHVGQLFRGLDSLGSDPRTAVSMLGRGGVSPGSRVLDLACGKGGVGVAVAKKFGCAVVGIDACREFVGSARLLASAKRVEDRCRFRVGDVTTFRAARAYDVGMMLGLLGVEKAAPLLRKLVRPGGMYLIDDAFLDVGRRALSRSQRAMYQGVPTLADARRVFEGLGDTILEENVLTRKEFSRLSRRLFARVRTRAGALARKEAGLAREIEEFLERQREANVLLGGPIRPAIWLVRRG